MIFTIEPNEAAFIVRVIGQLPTESGAFPLHQKLVTQLKAQDDEGQQQAQAAKEAMKPGEPE